MIFLVQSSKFTLLKNNIFISYMSDYNFNISLCSYMTCIACIFKKTTKRIPILIKILGFLRFKLTQCFWANNLVDPSPTDPVCWRTKSYSIPKQDVLYVFLTVLGIYIRELIVKKLEEESIGPYTRTHSYASEVLSWDLWRGWGKKWAWINRQLIQLNSKLGTIL